MKNECIITLIKGKPSYFLKYVERLTMGHFSALGVPNLNKKFYSAGGVGGGGRTVRLFFGEN